MSGFAVVLLDCFLLCSLLQENLVRSLKEVLTNPQVPPHILQTLLNLAEFMEHEVEVGLSRPCVYVLPGDRHPAIRVFAVSWSCYAVICCAVLCCALVCLLALVFSRRRFGSPTRTAGLALGSWLMTGGCCQANNACLA